MRKYDLYLSGTVGWSITADYVKYMLDKSKGGPVTIAVSSLGGYVHAGLQIYELIKNHGNVTVEFLGMNASAATFMVMGAKEIRMAKNALMLIHNSMTWTDEWGSKNKEQIDETIKRLQFQRDQLSTIDDVLAQIYADRNHKSLDDVKAKMRVAAWLKASDAKDFGIVDDIIEAEKVENMITNRICNSIISDMGLPSLPQDFNIETGDSIPTVGLIQKAVDALQDLYRSFSAKNKVQNMKKIFLNVMALLALEGFEPNDKEEITLSKDQMQKIDDTLKQQDDACKKAKTVIDSQKAKIDELQKAIDQKDQEIKDLKKAPGESGNGGSKANAQESGLNGAAELFDSIKGAM